MIVTDINSLKTRRGQEISKIITVITWYPLHSPLRPVFRRRPGGNFRLSCAVVLGNPSFAFQARFDAPIDPGADAPGKILSPFGLGKSTCFDERSGLSEVDNK
jgi:hypothetical protein